MSSTLAESNFIFNSPFSYLFIRRYVLVCFLLLLSEYYRLDNFVNKRGLLWLTPLEVEGQGLHLVMAFLLAEF
jgi:hypothetical protein